MEYQYASNGKGNLGVTLGAIGSGLAVLNGGLGLFGNGGWGNNYHNTANGRYITKDELDSAQVLASKDSEIALLKAESDSEKKMIDVFERLSTRIQGLEKEQSAWNTAQMVANAQMNSAIGINANNITTLQALCSNLTKVVIPADNVCPKPMPQYNSWTAPTTPTA